MFISMRLAKTGQVHQVISNITEFEMDGLNVLKDDLKLGTQIFIVLGGDKGKSEVDWELGLYAIGHVSREPYDIGYEKGKKTDYFKIMVSVDYKFPRPLDKNKLMFYEDSYNATFIGIEIKRSQTQAIGSLEYEKVIAVLRALLDYKLISRDKIEELFDDEIVKRVLGYVKKLLPVNVLYGQDDYSAMISQYSNLSEFDKINYYKTLSLEKLITAYNEYNKELGIRYFNSYNWWINIWSVHNNGQKYFWNIIENSNDEEILNIVKEILLSKKTKSKNFDDLAKRRFYEIKAFKKFVFSDTSIDYINEIQDNDMEVAITEPLPFSYNRILYGAPGTGKSHRLKRDITNSDIIGDNYERVTFHPAYTYSQFVGTYKPVKDKDNSISYKYVMGPFMRVLGRAIARPDENFILVIEEINRANVTAVFGDIFQLLDRIDGRSEYEIDISDESLEELKIFVSGYGYTKVDELTNKLGIPSNMYIWATMNSADQGVMPLDTAFKRRWDFEYIGINDGEDEIKDCTFTINNKKVNWNSLRKHINSLMATAEINEDKWLGPFFISKHILDKGDFKDTFKSKVLMYLFEDSARYEMEFIIKENYQKNCKTLSGLFNVFEKHDVDIFVGSENIEIETITDGEQ